MRKVLAVIAGLIGGGILVAVAQFGLGLINPPPEGFDWQNPEAVNTYIESLSVAQLLAVVGSQSAGALVGSLICTLVAGRRFLLGCLLIGGFFFVAGVMNDLVAVKHPAWFVTLDLILYFPAALLGGFLGNQGLLKLAKSSQEDLQPGMPSETG